MGAGQWVPNATAYRWSQEPAVRAEIESIRRRAIDRAVGRLATRATWAVDGIVELGENADSESVRLSALRAVMPYEEELRRRSQLSRHTFLARLGMRQ